jgi:hypothetical protein
MRMKEWLKLALAFMERVFHSIHDWFLYHPGNATSETWAALGAHNDLQGHLELALPVM